jgi:hypothetical protein
MPANTTSPLDRLPEPKRSSAGALLSGLTALPGVVAVALGGSYASGMAHADSDVDLGVYYRPKQPFEPDEVRRMVAALYPGPELTVTGFYQWGPWVNGGAWIPTPGSRTDLLYRNLEQLDAVIQESQAGVYHWDYWQQPSYGFVSVISLAEIQICQPLHDPEGVLDGLKARVQVYPPALRRRIVSDCLWQAEFARMHAEKSAQRGDVYNTVGCTARALACLTQVLFALNRVYFISDKGALQRIEGFELRPPNYKTRVEALLAQPGETFSELVPGVARLEQLRREVAALASVI